MNITKRTWRAGRLAGIALALGAVSMVAFAACGDDDRQRQDADQVGRDDAGIRRNIGRDEGGTTDYSALSGNVVVDGSSTVGPITEAVAEEFGKASKREGVRRHLGHGRRVREVLQGRDGHQRRLAPDQGHREDGLRRRGVEFIEFKVGDRWLDGRGQPGQHLGDVPDVVADAQDLRPGQHGQQLEPGRPELPRPGAEDLQPRARTPARSTTSPRRSTGRSTSSATTPAYLQRGRQRARAGRRSATRAPSATSATRTTRRTKTS